MVGKRGDMIFVSDEYLLSAEESEIEAFYTLTLMEIWLL